jgi:hypothetical protein
MLYTNKEVIVFRVFTVKGHFSVTLTDAVPQSHHCGKMTKQDL